ncbi:uncharacterized protein LOC114078357 [Solanum pennellii]|uniref:Uncharacterized protein LOC114078357 n=1 Tax=Solanum pennellii TaxID=28526 RepID=A0ABM1VGI5_SOLPN|nr:uncharacterized protein LOC114078357 [Solanum pennellii]
MQSVLIHCTTEKENDNDLLLIRHSGKWSDENCYVEYNIDGIVLKEYASYSDLVNVISVQLNIDLTKKCMKIIYTIEGDDTPMEIRNDMETSIESDVLQLEYNKELNSEDDPLAIVPAFGDQTVDAFDVENDLIITNRSQKEIMVDQIYMDKSTLKDVMEKYSIEKRFKFLVERSNSISYTLVCQSKECTWLMKASSINKSKMFRIRVFNSEHTCPLKDGVHSDCRATSSLIGGIIAPKLRNHKRKYSPNDIKDDIKLDLGIDINYTLAWRSKEKALESIMGQPAASYGKLPGYLYTLDKTYPGSHIRMKKTPNDEFLYVFIALDAFIKKFDHCRPIVVVDASHLKSAYTGAFVSANTMDGAGLSSLKNYLEMVEYEKWAKLYAPVPHGWVMTSNIAEYINSTLVAARELPIFDFLEQVAPSTDYVYSVSDEGKSYIVCLEKKTCSCNMFQVDGIPCSHAWSVLNKNRMLQEEYCLDFYKRGTILKTYEVPVYPLPDKSEWNIPEHIATEVVLPPKFKRPPGRPKKQREKSLCELSKRKGTNSCSTCGQQGHNRRSCRTATRNA